MPLAKNSNDGCKDLEDRVAALLPLSNQDLYVRRFDVDSAQAMKDNLMKERIAAAERYYIRLQNIQSKIDNLRATLAECEIDGRIGRALCRAFLVEIP